jgi:tetratricopeptide (TPR) repeat protein
MQFSYDITNINQVISKINEFMPQTFSLIDRYNLISQNNNEKYLMELLNFCDQYPIDYGDQHPIYFYDPHAIDFCSQLELRNNLFDYHIASRKNTECEYHVQWLLNQIINWNDYNDYCSKFCSDYYKSVAAYYLVNIGVYFDFYKNDPNKSLEFYCLSSNIMNNIDEFPRTWATIYFQQCLTHIKLTNIDLAKKNLNRLDDIIKTKLIPLFPDPIENNRIWFLHAKINMLEGDYNEALVSINKLIEKESSTQNQVIGSGTMLCKVEILNNLEKYDDALEIINTLNNFSIEFQMRVQLEKLKSYIGLGKKGESTDIIYQLDESMINQNESLKNKYNSLKILFEKKFVYQ